MMEEETEKSYFGRRRLSKEGTPRCSELKKFVEQAYSELEYRHVEIEALLESTRAVLQCRDSTDVAIVILSNCMQLTGAAVGYVALLSSEKTQNVLLHAAPEGLNLTVDPPYEMPVTGLLAEAYRGDTGVFHNGLQNDKRLELRPETGENVENVLFSPLVIRGKADGMLCFSNKPGGFNDTDIQITTALADIAAIAYNNIRADEELQESEKRYKTLVESVTDYIYTLETKDGVLANTKHGPGCLAVTGYSSEEFENDPCLWYRIISEKDRSAALLRLEAIMTGMDVQPLEHRIIHKDSGVRWVRNTIVRRFDNSERLVTYDGLISDITERKTAEEELLRTNRSLKLLGCCNEHLVRANNEKDLLRGLCELIVTEGGYSLAWVGLRGQEDETALKPAEKFGDDKGYLDEEIKLGTDTVLQQRPEEACIRSGKPVVINDILNDFAYASWRNEAARCGFISIASLPLHIGNKTFGCLNINATEREAFDEEEIRLLAELAGDLAFGIASHRLCEAKNAAEKKIKEQFRRLQKLAETGFAISGEPADVFNMIVVSLAELLDVPTVCLAEVRDDKLRFLSVFSKGDLTSDADCCSLGAAPWVIKAEGEEAQVCHDVAGKFPDAEFLRRYNAFSFCGFPVRDSEGRVVAVICLLDERHHDFSDEDKYLLRIFGQRIAAEMERHRNLLERSKIEKSMKESENHYRTLFERANDAIFILTAEGEDAGMIVSANHAAADMHGYTVDELATMCITDLCSTESAGKGPGLLQRCLRGELVKTEHDHRKKDGRVFPVEVSAGMLELKGHRFVLVFDRDITERKKSELERDRLIGELQRALIRASRSRKQWQDTFDSITDHISIIGRDFTIMKANRSFAESHGLSATEVPGNKCHALVHGCDSPVENCPHLLTIQETNPVTAEVLDPKTKGVFRVSTYPYRSHEGELIGTIHIARDITEEKERAVKLRRSERLASLGQFSAAMAHEIKNPINFIKGNAQLLSQIWDDVLKILSEQYEEGGDFYIGGFSFAKNHERITKLFTGIEDGSHRINNIVNNLKVFSRAKNDAHKMPVDLNSVIGATIMILHSQIRSHTEKFIVDVEDNLPMVTGNGHDLEQVMSNLVLNALQSLQSNACGVTLSAKFKKDKDCIVIQTRDEGIGMTAEVLEKVCEPFFTTKGGRGGTGLGLSICRSIIEQHGGSLKFESKLGEGTTATVTLPLTLSGENAS